MITSLLPITVIGIQFGAWIGFLCGIFLIPANFALLNFWLGIQLTDFNLPALLFAQTGIAATGGILSGLVRTRRELTKELAARTAAENALSQHQIRYKQIIEKSSSAIVILNSNGAIQYMNPIGAVITGYPLDEIIGKHYARIIHPDHSERVREYYRKQIREKISETTIEFPIISKSGEIVWISQTTDMTFEDDQPPVIQGLFQDISDRIRIEQNLKEREERYRALTENTSDIILVHDKQGKYIYASPSVERFIGMKKEEFIDKTPADFIHADDLGWINLKMRELRHMEEGASIFIPQFRGHPRYKGENTYYQGTVTNMLHIPSVNGYVFTGRDITKQVMAEQALKANEERFRAFAENHQDITLLVNEDIHSTYISPTVENLLGYSAEELVGNLRNKVLLPEDFKVIQEKVK
ncbi:MAG: PAS domain S-box protein, partial [Anaerolineae bacterium]|nr:PAS domain S-box protein [Anaerolineae bacterium]